MTENKFGQVSELVTTLGKKKKSPENQSRPLLYGVSGTGGQEGKQCLEIATRMQMVGTTFANYAGFCFFSNSG